MHLPIKCPLNHICIISSMTTGTISGTNWTRPWSACTYLRIIKKPKYMLMFNWTTDNVVSSFRMSQVIEQLLLYWMSRLSKAIQNCLLKLFNVGSHI